MIQTTITGSNENDLKFFEYLHNGYVNDNTEQRLKVKGALQAFMRKPTKTLQRNIEAFQKQKIQGFSVSTDFSILPRGFYDLVVEETNYDMGWEAAYKLVPKDKNILTWTIYTAGKAITIKKIPEGGHCEVAEITGEHITAEVDYYGGGLGWTDKMIRYREIAAMLDKAAMFRNAFYTAKANRHYLLLSAAGALNITTFQGAAADGQLQRDIQTINRCAFDIGNANKDKGYGDTANMPFVIYANPGDQNRIEAAFNVTTTALAAAGRTGDTVLRRIQRIYTYNSNITAQHPLMVLPGWRIQRAEDMPPTTYNAPIDITSLNQIQTVWEIDGAVIADTDQVRQFNLV